MGVDKWAELGACDTCWSRKVKCVRSDEKDKTCDACKFRREPCENSRNSRTNTKQRKRNAQVPHKTTSSTAAKDKVVALSHHSTESSLQRIELSETFTAELLSSYFTHSDEEAPYADLIRVQTDFEFAGRRLSQLNPLQEPLLLAMISCAAQFSDSRMLLGINAPRLKQLTSSQSSTNLVPFGYRRQQLCEQLARRVVQLIDARGLFRKPTQHSISVLAMMPRVLRHPTKWKGLEDLGDTWRPYLSSAFSHIRALYETQGAENVKIGILLWPMTISDACTAALSGGSLLVTDNDLRDWPHMSGIPPPSPAMVRGFIASNDPMKFRLPLVATMNEIITIARRIAKTISIPQAKKRHVELSTFAERIEETRAFLNNLRECGHAAKDVESTMSPALLEMQKYALGASASTYHKFAAVTPALLMPALNDQFEIYKKNQGPVTAFGENNYMEHLSRLRIQQQLQMGLIEVILIIVEAIQELEGKDIVASLTRQTSILSPMQERVTLYLELALDLPTIEQNGPSPIWNHEVKKQSLRTLLDAAELQAWAWSDRAAAVAVCQYRYKEYLDSILNPPSPPLVVETTLGLDSPIMLSSSSSTSGSDAHTYSSPPLTDDAALPTVHPPTLPTIVDESELGSEYTDLWQAPPPDQKLGYQQYQAHTAQQVHQARY